MVYMLQRWEALTNGSTPFGLNRGGIVGVVSVLNRLTHIERDTLYEGKVNPIVQFPLVKVS